MTYCSVLPRASKSQSIPTSRHLSTLDIADLRLILSQKGESLEHVDAQHHVDQPEGYDGEDKVAHPLAGSFGISVGHALIVCAGDRFVSLIQSTGSLRDWVR